MYASCFEKPFPFCLAEQSAADDEKDMKTFMNDLYIEPLILETVQMEEQIINDMPSYISDNAPTPYVVTDVKMPSPLKKAERFTACYEALILRDNTLCASDDVTSKPMVSRDRFTEDDIAIATIEELLFRLKTIRQVLETCSGEPLRNDRIPGDAFLENSNFPEQDFPENVFANGNGSERRKIPGVNIPVDPQYLETLKHLQAELDDELYPEYKQITMASKKSDNNNITRRVGLLVDVWNTVTFELSERRRRAAENKPAESDGIRDAVATFLSDVEKILLSQHGMTALPDDLERQLGELNQVQHEFADHEGKMETLKDKTKDVGSAKSDVPHMGALITRWERARVQTRARVQQLSDARARVAKFRDGLLRETSWLEKVYEKFKRDDVETLRGVGGTFVMGDRPPYASPTVSPCNTHTPKTHRVRTARLLKQYAGISRKLTRHRRRIQGIFYGAEEFILGSKMYEKDLKHFFHAVNGRTDESCRYQVIISLRL